MQEGKTDGRPASWELAPALTLGAAHLIWALAMAGFALRVGQPPIDGAALVFYALAGAGVVGLLVANLGGRWARQAHLFALLTLWLVVLYVLGISGPFAPWGHFDWGDVLPWLFVPTLLATAIVGALYRDPKVFTLGAGLFLAATLGLAAVFTPLDRCGGLNTAAACLDVFVANLARIWVAPILASALVLVVGGFVSATPRWRGAMAGPPAWVAPAIAGAVGGYLLYMFSYAYLPTNGAGLGWIAPDFAVPARAWGPLRALAAEFALGAVGVAGVVGGYGLWRWVRGADRAEETGPLTR